MNKRTTLWERCTLSKLMLVAILVFGGGNLALADDIVIVDGSTIASGWTTNSITTGEDYITASTTSMSTLTSPSDFSISNKKLVVNAQRIEDSEAYIGITTGTSLYSYTYLFAYKRGTSTTYTNYNELFYSDGYMELISDNITTSGTQVKIIAKNVKISSMKICDDKAFVLDESKPTAL